MPSAARKSWRRSLPDLEAQRSEGGHAKNPGLLADDQKAALKSISGRACQKQSTLVRKGVDPLIDRALRDDADRRQATRAAAGLWKDRTDIEEIGRSAREAAKRRFTPLCRQK